MQVAIDRVAGCQILPNPADPLSRGCDRPATHLVVYVDGNAGSEEYMFCPQHVQEIRETFETKPMINKERNAPLVKQTVMTLKQAVTGRR